jgi:hypothetical protein
VSAVLILGLASGVAARQEALLDVAAGQIPTDTGSDGATKMTIEERTELGGKALKVVFAAGDSFGDRAARIKNWKQFLCLQFAAVNPGTQDVPLTLTVKHRRTTGYQTRVDMPFTLRPGKNDVKLGIDEMVNVNGSTPDLANVERWYFACADGATPTLYFGNLWLVGDDAPPGGAARPAPAAGTVAGPAGTFRVTGKVGDMPVELLVAPLGGTAPVAGALPQAPTTPAEPKAAALVQPSRGQLPNDTGSPATKLSIEERPELGGKALKVAFASGDSFGQTVVKVKDWRPFLTIQFDVFNPSQEKVQLALNVKHKRSTSYPTRIEVPFAAPPGKTAVKLSLDEMSNVNGSAPDFSAVTHWYVICQNEKPPLMYFGDFWLVPAGGSTPPPGAPPTAASKPPAADPARLARIRSVKLPPITRPVMFDTPEADAILAALEIFPPDNPWNQVVSDWPVHPNSQKIIASIGPDKPLRYNPDMGFILVPPNQKKVELAVVEYPNESDKGPFPIPDNMPIEGWPVCALRDANYQGWTLEDIQRDRGNRGGDRHGIVVDPVNRMLYEFFVAKKTDRGWQAAQASIFDLKTNQLRPDGWTSADAAGLPIFPAVVRYDELKRGRVEHALRVTVVKTRREYVAPATHYASRHTNEEYPRMGERIRLRRDYDVSALSPEVQAILNGLKQYGMFVADNGIDWAISVAPDARIPVLHEELRKVRGSAFEVVVPPE